MSTVYAGQNLQLTLDSSVDVTSATTLQIRMKNPAGTVTNITASDVDTTKARVSLSTTHLATAGTYLFQNYAVISSAIYIGRVFQLEVKDVFN
jgi:hypothetical protein